MVPSPLIRLFFGFGCLSFLSLIVGDRVVHIFNKNHVGVSLDTFQPNHGVGVAIDCDENDLISVVSQIAATFSNITVAFRAAEPTSCNLIPSVVAKYNKYHLKPKERPVKLSVAFRQCENGTVLGFQNAFEKATEANKIYPGTVSIIYIEYLEGKVEELLSCLATAKKSLKNTEIELGAAVPFEDCFEMELAMVLKHVRNLAFTMLFQSKSNNTYIQPIVVVKEVWHMFAQCENRLKKYGKSISSVELRSGWHNFNLPSRFHEQVGTHEENLITFWERMGEYAEKYNRKLVLMEAFDDPNKVGFHFNKSGWWRLVQKYTVCYSNSSQYHFEEKRNGIMWTNKKCFGIPGCNNMYKI